MLYSSNVRSLKSEISLLRKSTFLVVYEQFRLDVLSFRLFVNLLILLYCKSIMILFLKLNGHNSNSRIELFVKFNFSKPLKLSLKSGGIEVIKLLARFKVVKLEFFKLLRKSRSKIQINTIILSYKTNFHIF